MSEDRPDKAVPERFRPLASAAADARLAMLNASPMLAMSWLATFDGLEKQYERRQVAMLFALLRSADLWYLSADMVEVMEAAAPSMPPQQMLPEDPPSYHGLALLGRSVADADGEREGATVYTNALAWQPVAHHHDGHHSLCIASLSYFGPQWGWFVSGQEAWNLGETQHDARSESGVMDRARIATMWTLAQQKRLAGDSTATNRAAMRRTTRAGLPPEAASVRLLDVRRPAGASTGNGGTVDYSHRWMVSGHWRNQWLPSRGTHRAQWIAPYVKGPDDKPLVIRTDVAVVK